MTLKPNGVFKTEVSSQTKAFPVGWQVAVEAGMEMLRAGADTSRVEDTIERIGRSIGAEQVDAFVTPTGLFVSLEMPDGRTLTAVRRIRSSENNIAVITAVNNLSRQLATGQINELEAWQLLLTIKSERSEYTPQITSLGAGFTSAAFAYLFGGRFIEMVFAWLAGFFVFWTVHFLRRYRLTQFLRCVIGGSVAALWGTIPLLFYDNVNKDIIILGGLMVLVPGLAITNAIRDIMSGELVSGVSRVAEALTIALALAVGVAVVLGISGLGAM